nr:hypothetical protein [Paucibacter aquatile]
MQGLLRFAQRHSAQLHQGQRQIGQQLGLGAAEHQALQGLVHIAQRHEAGHAARAVAVHMLGQEIGQRALAVAIQQLHQGQQDLRLAVEQLAAQHQHKAAARIELLEALQRGRIQALSFVDDDEIGAMRLQRIQILGQGVERGNLDLAGGGQLLAPRRCIAPDQAGAAVAQALRLAEPAGLCRLRAQQQHALHAKVTQHQLGRTQRRGVEAQTQIVGHQAAARAGGEQGRLQLVMRQRQLQKIAQALAVKQLRIGLTQQAHPLSRIGGQGQVLPDSVRHPQLMAGLGRLAQQPGHGAGARQLALSNATQHGLNLGRQRLRAGGRSTPDQLATGAAAEVQFAVLGLPTGRQAIAQLGEQELAMLAAGRIAECKAAAAALQIAGTRATQTQLPALTALDGLHLVAAEQAIAAGLQDEPRGWRGRRLRSRSLDWRRLHSGHCLRRLRLFRRSAGRSRSRL